MVIFENGTCSGSECEVLCCPFFLILFIYLFLFYIIGGVVTFYVLVQLCSSSALMNAN